MFWYKCQLGHLCHANWLKASFRFCVVPSKHLHCVKSVCIRSFSGPYFPTFGLNTNKYSLSLRIQFECGKVWTRKSPHMDTFHVVRNSSSSVLRSWNTFLISYFIPTGKLVVDLYDDIPVILSLWYLHQLWMLLGQNWCLASRSCTSEQCHNTAPIPFFISYNCQGFCQIAIP